MIRVLVAVALLGAIARAADPGESERLLAETRDANRKAIEAIRTLSVSFDVKRIKVLSSGEILDPDAAVGPGLFRRSADGYRLRTSRGDGFVGESVGRFGRGQSLGRGGPLPEPEFTVGPAEHEQRLWIWYDLLVSHPGPNPVERFPFHGLLNEPHKLLGVVRDEADTRVSLSHAGGQLDLWFAPGHGGLVRKRVWRPVRSELAYEWAVAAFIEPERGVFLPSAVEHRIIRNGVAVEVRQLNLADVQVNRPLPANSFRIPDLTELTFTALDLSMPLVGQPTRTIQYKVDADGYRKEVVAERPTPSAGVVLRPIGGGPNTAIVDPQTEKPLAPWWVWGGLVSLGIVVAAGLFEIVNLRRQLRQAMGQPSR